MSCQDVCILNVRREFDHDSIYCPLWHIEADAAARPWLVMVTTERFNGQKKLEPNDSGDGDDDDDYI